MRSWALLLCGLAACAGTGAPSSQPAAQTADTRPIPEIWRARCGNCHERVQPGEHTREFLVSALGRHQKKKRVRLTDEQWQAMIDFLAAPHPAPLPD